MKLNENPQLPSNTESEYDKRLYQSLYQVLKAIAVKVNQIASGTFAGRDNQSTAAPTTGSYAQGDEVLNSNPTELGTAGAKYVIRGWVCTVSGTPGTWVQQRFLTGN